MSKLTLELNLYTNLLPIIINQLHKQHKSLKRLQWAVIAQGLSLLAIVYLLWLKL